MFVLIFLIFILIYLVPIGVLALTLIEQWYIFKKAGREGWESIIPVYNNMVLIEITGLPMWYIALLFIPFANIYASIRIFLELSYRFNKGTGFGIGLYFLTPIFLGILAFDKKCLYNKPVNNTKSFCYSCGGSINPQDRFCTKCGINLNNNICRNCGNKINEKDNFCKSCGNSVK